MIFKLLNQSDKRRKITFPEKNEELAEFMGILSGDGFINEYKTRQAYIIEITGNKLKDKDYLENFVVKMTKNLFNFIPKIYEKKNENTIRLVICSKGIFYFLKENYFPVGRKGEIVPPKWIINNSLLLKKFIRGFFDTDGYLCLKNKERKKYPVIGIVSKSKSLLTIMQDFLKSLGISSYLGSHSSNNNPRYEKSWIVYKLQISGNKNIKTFFKEIGSNNPRNLNKYNEYGDRGNRTPAARASVVCSPIELYPLF